MFFFLRLRVTGPQIVRKSTQSEEFKELLSPATIAIDAQGATFENQFRFENQPWIAFECVFGNQDYLFLHVDQNNVRIIPKRAFDSPADADAFHNFARQYCPQHSHCPKCHYSLRGNPGPQCPECGAPI